VIGLHRPLKNVRTTAEAGGFSRPMKAIIFRLQPRFDSVLFVTHQGTRFLSHAAVCVALRNFDNTNGQTGAEALNLCQSIGRLKPPASTVAPAFFSGLFRPCAL